MPAANRERPFLFLGALIAAALVIACGEQAPAPAVTQATPSGETLNVAKGHPGIVERLSKLADDARADLGDALAGREGAGVRPAGKL